MEKTVKITIDGPAGSGKTTIAKQVSKDLGFRYIDTGAMYRAVAFACMENGVDARDSEGIKAVLSKINLTIEYTAVGEQKVILDGVDISDRIRTNEISNMASAVSANKNVRLKLVEVQRNLATKHNVIMDGRDAGSFVLPHADIKIFLMATTEDRARRRYEELAQRGEEVTYEKVLADVRRRDRNDCSRSFAPLVIPDNAVIADTTDFTLEESIQTIRQAIVERLPSDVLRHSTDS